MQDDITTQIAELEKVLSEDDPDPELIREGVDKLQQAAMKMGEAIYKNQSSEAEAEQGGAKDAEYEEVKDEKKDDKKD